MESSITVHTYGNYVGVRIFPTESPPSHPFHLALLIDTSGSMASEGRLETVQQTLYLLLDHLREGDALTLVSYNHDAKILCIGEQDKYKLYSCISQLEAKGGTNFEAAFLALQSLPTESIDTIFLLTDGCVNQGITSTAGLRSLAFSCFPKHSIHTLGYGDNHNSELLQAISQMSQASYTYAEKKEMIPNVVGSIVGGLYDQVANHVEVVWTEGKCLELGSTEGRYWVGSVLTNKEQWIVFEGPVTGLRVRWTGGEYGKLNRTENLAVLPQVFRTRSVALFQAIKEDTYTDYTDALNALEQEILASPVANHPLILKLYAELAEMRFYIQTRCGRSLIRLRSNMQQMSVQRGRHFASPRQEQIATQFTQSFTQDPMEVPYS